MRDFCPSPFRLEGIAMKRILGSRSKADNSGVCAICGAPYQSERGWSLSDLLPSDTNHTENVCPSCRQHDMTRRIGAFLSHV